MERPIEGKVIVITMKPESKLSALYDRSILYGFYRKGMYYHTVDKHPLTVWVGDIESWEYFE